MDVMNHIASFNRFEIELPEECIFECYTPGRDADRPVSYWAEIVQINVAPEILAEELREYGAWSDEELKDHAANIKRIIWIAACDLAENNSF